MAENVQTFEWEQKPPGTSWVRELNAAQAIAQCNKWGLTPASTLEANRVLLRDHIKTTCGSQPGTPTNETPNITLQPPTPQDTVQPEWVGMVQATAEAVGRQVALALGRHGADQHGSSPLVVRDLAGAAPHCNGTDALTLLKFLKVARQMVQLQLAANKQILIALLSKTAGQLRAMWTEAILYDTPVNKVVQDIVNTFLPDRARQQLLTQSVYRLQGANESLADFVMEIREAADILLPPGFDMLDIILTGINAPTRARMAGFPAPTQVSDLLSLIPRLEVIRQRETEPVNSRAAHAHTGDRWQRQPGQSFSGSRAPFHPNNRAYWARQPTGGQPHRPPPPIERPVASSRGSRHQYQPTGPRTNANQPGTGLNSGRGRW